MTDADRLAEIRHVVNSGYSVTRLQTEFVLQQLDAAQAERDRLRTNLKDVAERAAIVQQGYNDAVVRLVKAEGEIVDLQRENNRLRCIINPLRAETGDFLAAPATARVVKRVAALEALFKHAWQVHQVCGQFPNTPNCEICDRLAAVAATDPQPTPTRTADPTPPTLRSDEG